MTDEEVREAMREADRQAYEQRKAEEKKKKQVQEEERIISSQTKTGAPTGWVEPMGPSSSDKGTSAKEPKGKKNKLIGTAEIKDDKKDDE